MQSCTLMVQSTSIVIHIFASHINQIHAYSLNGKHYRDYKLMK